VRFKSTAGSAPGGDDVKVEVTLSGVSGKASKVLAIYAPKSLTYVGIADVSDAGFGYISRIYYSVQDNLSHTLPYPVEMNESFTGAVVDDYAGTNWARGPAKGGMGSPSLFCDMIGGQVSPCTPTPQSPQTPLGSIKIHHFPGDWYVGSVTPGSGVLVKSGIKWQRYQDHARHE
jgi:hypothetical protein